MILVLVLEAVPGLDQIVDATKSVGYPIVVTFLVLIFVVAPLFAVVRILVGGINKTADSLNKTSETLGSQITAAVTLFSGTLAVMSNRQEQALDRVDDRLAALIEGHRVSMDKLAEAIKDSSDSSRRTGELVAGMNESLRIQLNHTSQQMAQQAALTEQVSKLAAAVGSPVSTESILGVTKAIEQGS